MLSVLLLGLLLGMKHAMEADHLAAVATLASRSRTVGEVVRLGLAWSIGHTITLFAVASLVLVFGIVAPQGLTRLLELAVGAMLVLLGGDVLRRMIRDRVHFHIHQHRDKAHLHAHSHAGEDGHAASPHDHAHGDGMTSRAVLVGLVHGLAGSAVLVVLTLAATDSPWTGLAYLVLFGVGSIAGMAVLSLAIAVPLSYSARHLSRSYDFLQVAVATVTMGIGWWLIYDNPIVVDLLG